MPARLRVSCLKFPRLILWLRLARLKVLRVRPGYRWLGVGIPCAVYVAYVAVAFLLGRAHSCDLGGELYFWFGVLTLPLLAVTPLICGLSRSRALSVFLGAGFAFLGWIVWLGASAVAGMALLCELR